MIPFLGWVLGAVLVWLSRLWTTRDKLVGTVGGLSWVLGGLGTVMVGREGGPVGQPGVGTVGPNPLEPILVVAPFVLPVAAAIYLGVRLRARTAAVPATRLPS